jgi:uncharacterized membrane protein
MMAVAPEPIVSPPVPASNVAPRPAPGLRGLIASAEGRLLAIGLGLAGLMSFTLGLAAIVWPDTALVLAAMTGLNLLIGRAAGMAYGYASGLGHVPVIALNVFVETVQVLVVYSLFVLSWRHWVHVPRLQPLLDRMHASAQARREGVQRFGVVGLLAFVFMPLWMTGPVVGAIIGFLIGLRLRTTLTAVLTATYVAIGSYAALMDPMRDWAIDHRRFALLGLAVALGMLWWALRPLLRRPR